MSGSTAFPLKTGLIFPFLLALSAATPGALADRARSYRDWLRADGADRLPLEDICYTATVRRGALRNRLAVVGRSHTDLAQQLEDALPGLAQGTQPGESRRPKATSSRFPARLPLSPTAALSGHPGFARKACLLRGHFTLSTFFQKRRDFFDNAKNVTYLLEGGMWMRVAPEVR